MNCHHLRTGCAYWRLLSRAVALVATLLLAGHANALLPIQDWTTSTGARVLLVVNRDLPMLDVSIDFPAGSGFDSQDKAGLASYTNHLLKLGAGGLSENEISQRIADVGARLAGRFDSDRAGVSLRTLSSATERDRALDIMIRVVQQPEFPEAVLAREKARGIAGLKEADTKPDTIAARTFRQLVFRAHPYGLRSSGEVETVTSLARSDLLDFYRRHYVADRAVVAIMGDVTRVEAERIAEQLTTRLPRAVGGKPSVSAVSALERSASAVIAHPASQAHILVGSPGISRADPDYFPLFVGNHILGGGGFASRLNEEVRQKRGLAYSVYSVFAPLLQAGAFQIGLQTRGDQAQAALKVVRDTLIDFVSHGPSERELAEAKENLVGGFPMRIDSNGKIHEYLATIGFYDLPLAYLDEFVPSIRKVTVAGIKAAFERHVKPERMVTVVVGGGADIAAAK